MTDALRTIASLQDALAALSDAGDPPLRVSRRVDPYCELAGTYAWYGAGAPASRGVGGDRPLLFDNVGQNRASVLLGLFGSRDRCAYLLGCRKEEIADRIIAAAKSPMAPAITTDPAPSQEVVLGRIDLSSLPIPTIASADSGPYITMGVVLASEPDGTHGNISIHRMCVKSPDTLTIWMVPGRDLEQLYLQARDQGRRLPISINIGLDPAIYVASACTGPLASRGLNELGIAGAIRRQAVRLAPCLNVSAMCIADAEYVIEGEIGHESIPEGPPDAKSMPEFLGYDGSPHPALPVVYVKTITHRKNPVFQSVIGPGYEQSHLLAFGMEAAILDFFRRYITETVRNVRAHTGGGGQLLIFVQVRKQCNQDDGIVRRGGVAVLGAFRMVKQLVLVDDDVDLYDDQDLWWAMATRFQAGKDILIVSNVQGFPLDPSQAPEFHPALSGAGMTDKVVLDCTVPYGRRERFKRSEFSQPSEELMREIRSCE